MEENTSFLQEEADALISQGKFDDVITLLNDEELEVLNNAELYLLKGNAWYNKSVYNNAIVNYTKAIKINPRYELAFYNRGQVWIAIKKYAEAIKDFDKVIEFNPNYTNIYVSRASAWKIMEVYDKAIIDYTKAIEVDPNDPNAYYYRGLTKKENNIDMKGSKEDFEKYLKLITDESDIGYKYAKFYVKRFDEINDKKLSVIVDLISKIKEILLLDEECITHYTSLSVLKSLLLDCSKFRISEGNFLNDSSEGLEFYKFLNNNTTVKGYNGSFVESYSPKPFIGSFVAKDKYDDLNMWRLYGKELGEEAKGCAITLRMEKFKEDIKNVLSNEKNIEARLDDESDINFYQIAYLTQESNIFYIPNSDKKSQKLTNLMTKLREKVKLYKGNNTTSLDEYLNSIAFLFKSDNYKNENQVRLVLKGIEFEKEYNMIENSPKVYIELVCIKNVVSQITFGPKVDKLSEWKTAFYYRYCHEEEMPKIEISHLPYR